RIVPVFERQLPKLAQSRVQLLFRALPHAAGVDNDHVGVRGLVGRFKAGLLEQPRHPFRVVDVHLTTERLDEILSRHVYGLRLPFALSLSPFAFSPAAAPSACAARSSRADALAASVTTAPPSIRAISSTRACRSSRATVVRVRPASMRFSIWKWVSAAAAICGRCVIQST